MSEQEKAALRERLRQFKALPLDEQARHPGERRPLPCAPPEEQARVRQNLEAFQRLSPDERQRLLDPVARVPEAPPGAAAADPPALMREYLDANPDRRRQMLENLREWRSMTREQREQMRQRLREMRERRGR